MPSYALEELRAHAARLRTTARRSAPLQGGLGPIASNVPGRIDACVVRVGDDGIPRFELSGVRVRVDDRPELHPRWRKAEHAAAAFPAGWFECQVLSHRPLGKAWFAIAPVPPTVGPPDAARLKPAPPADGARARSVHAELASAAERGDPAEYRSLLEQSEWDPFGGELDGGGSPRRPVARVPGTAMPEAARPRPSREVQELFAELAELGALRGAVPEKWGVRLAVVQEFDAALEAVRSDATLRAAAGVLASHGVLGDISIHPELASRASRIADACALGSLCGPEGGFEALYGPPHAQGGRPVARLALELFRGYVQEWHRALDA